MKFLAFALVIAVVFAESGIMHSVKSTYGWEQKTAAKKTEKVYTTFAVKQNNLDVIDALFWQVSNPKSDMYGNYLTFEQIGELVSNPEATEAVVKFLQDYGAEDLEVTPHGEYVSALFTVQIAERVFQTKFYNFEHADFEESAVKATSYVIPEPLIAYITHVEHITYFPTKSEPVISTTTTSPSADGNVTPQFLYNYYGIKDSVATSGKSSQSVFAALGQSFSPSDLSSFQSAYGLNSHSVDTVIGNNQAGICRINLNSCGEANLDVQYMTSVAQNVDTTFWRISRWSSNPFTDWINQLNSYGNIPLVHSISYGGPEYSDSSLTTFNQEMQKLGLRGVTVTVSSGDDGAVSSQVRSSTKYCAYSPSFPASCPYVTAVGATQGPEDGNDEVACASNTGGLITTGGGFSTVFDVPSYQKSNTESYLNNVSPKPASGYNAGGRGLPDVSLLGHNYVVVIGGRSIPVSGTSASSPAFAGMIALINDARLAAGKSSLGFLNQALYSLDSSVWNDITSGDNKCAAGNGSSYNCCSQGFTATEGWDPLTGLGTPKFEAFSEALASL